MGLPDDGEEIWKREYLNIDILIEFQVSFVHVMGFPLHTLYNETRLIQLDFGMLQINCINGQIDDIFSFIGLTWSLSPDHYKTQYRIASQRKMYLLDGGFVTFERLVAKKWFSAKADW